MVDGLKGLGAKLKDIGPADAPEPARTVKKPSVLRQRESLVSKAASGAMTSTSQMRVAPEDCRMWVRHNRLYDLLTSENCAELIDDIRAKGRNHTPAIARQLRDDPDGKQYEIIAGARRHFAISHLRETEGKTDIFLQIEIRRLSDEEAFLISDAENAGRKDISEYERALDYAGALRDFYDGNTSVMAKAIGKSRSSLRNFIYLAQLPDEVVSAFFAPTDIALRYAMPLKPKLNEPATKKLILNAAARITKEQDKARKLGNTQAYDGHGVFKQLITAAAGQPNPGGASTGYEPVTDERGKVIFEASQNARYLTVRIPTKDRSTPTQIAKELKKLLS